MELIDLFRVLSSFAPTRARFAGAPWEAYVDWAIGQGLAPLAAYNLEYRLGGAGAPEWARDRLLSVYQGSVNDNVMKLVSFKRAVDGLDGRRVMLFGGGSFAEALYPHVAFRPLLDLEVLVRPDDLQGFVGFLKESNFRPSAQAEDLGGAKLFVTDGHAGVLLFAELFGKSRANEEAGLFERALPAKVYGPSVRRLQLEDALLVACFDQARRGYQVPMVTFVDLRELLTGAPMMGGPYSRPLDGDVVRERARVLRIERAVYCSLTITARLFPEVQEVAARAMPQLRPATRRLLDRWVVQPLCTLGRSTAVKGTDRLRRLLSGGR